MPAAAAQNGQADVALEDARRPLLPPPQPAGGGEGDNSDSEADGELPTTSGCGGGGCSTAGGVANLVTTAVGAGMVALPRAVSGALAAMPWRRSLCPAQHNPGLFEAGRQLAAGCKLHESDSNSLPKCQTRPNDKPCWLWLHAETGILVGMALFAFTAALTYASTSIVVR